MKFDVIDKNMNRAYRMELSIKDGYFSLTGAISRVTKEEKFDERVKSRHGAIGNQLVLSFPDNAEYLLMNQIHLSDLDGVPMYAEENGLYYILNCSETAVRNHFRLVDDNTLHMLIESVKTAKTEEEQKKIVHNFCEDMKPEWKYQAQHVIRKYNL